MIAVYIICGILLLFVLVAFLRASVHAVLNDSGTEISVIILCFTIRLVPKKKKPVRLSDYEIKRFRRRRIKYLRRKAAAEEKKRRKKEKKKADSEKKAEKEKRSPVDTARTILDAAKCVLPPVLEKFGRYLYLKIDALAVIVRGGEPDETAIAFGYFSQAFAYVSEFINGVKEIKYGAGAEDRFGVAVDFTGGNVSADADVTAGMRVWQAVAVAITALRHLPKGTLSAFGGKKDKKSGQDKKDRPGKPGKNSKENKAAQAGEDIQDGKQHE